MSECENDLQKSASKLKDIIKFIKCYIHNNMSTWINVEQESIHKHTIYIYFFTDVDILVNWETYDEQIFIVEIYNLGFNCRTSQ